jgi:putative ABC transport system permease protein
MLTTFVGRFTTRTGEIGLDPWVLFFTVAVSLATGLAFGTLPALASRADPLTALKAGGRGSTGGGGRQSVQSGLIVAQVAVSVVLLVGAGLLLVSFYRLQGVDPGFSADRVVSAEAFGNFTKYPNPQTLRRLYVSVLERLQGTPGVLSAAVTNAVPLAGLLPGQTRFQIAGRTYDSPELRPTVDVRVASPGYFDTLGIPLRRGRTFTEGDHEDARQVALINESMVRQWEGRDPLESEVSFDNGQTWVNIVGIVGDTRTFGLDRDAVAQLYRPLRQTGGIAGRIMVRMNGTPEGAASALRAAVHAVDPDLPVENIRTLEEIRERSLATPRLTAMLLSVFAGLALVVTLAGITGVIATSVSQRTQEFGVRMALGASQNKVLAMVLRQGLVMVGIGLAIGVGAALLLSQTLQAYLYRTAPTDPLTFVLVAAAFVVAGTLACLGPALRATTVSPMKALRAD